MARPRRLTIKLSGSYRIDQRFDALLDALKPLLENKTPRPVTFDFGGLVGLGPTAIALFTCVVKDARERGVIAAPTKIVSPRSTPVWNYLMRMDVFKVILGEGAYERISEGFNRKEPLGFRPCREFIAYDDFPPVTRALTEALAEACEMDDLSRHSIRTCLDELAENVVYHADTPLGGFAAAQGWKRNGAFEIGIVDLGIGILKSLKKNPAYADIRTDGHAIQTALEPRSTSTPERNSGIGLFITRLLLKENGGFLMVRSGKATVYAGSKEEATVARTAFPGTIVALRARTDRPLNIKHVYRTLNEIASDTLEPRNESNTGNDRGAAG
jgi:anti-sigma regulatory factor (Ser/Thr protein kinase)